MEKAREQETLVDILEKRSKAPSRPSYVKSFPDWQPSKATVSSAPSSVSSQHTTTKIPEIKKISPQEMAKRREKGLCYNCDEIYSRGHKCQRPQLYLMVGDEADEPEIEVSLEEETEVDVSVHALQSTQGLHTLKVEGIIQNVPVTMLVDTGSTHNFVSQSLIKKLGIQTSSCTPMKVNLADGSQAQCTRLVSGLAWKTGNTTFQADF